MDNQQNRAYIHKNRRTTSIQFEKLVGLLEASAYLASGHYSIEFGYSKSKAEMAWENIAQSLNSIGPPRRSVSEWKKTWSDLRSRTRQNIAEINKCDLYLTEGRSKPLTPFELRVAKLCKFKTPKKISNKITVPPPKPIYKIAGEPSNFSPTQSTTFEISPPRTLTPSVSSAPELQLSTKTFKKTSKRKINKQKRLAYVKELELLAKQVSTQEEIVGIMESQVKSAEEHNKSLKEIAESSQLIASSFSDLLKHLRK